MSVVPPLSLYLSCLGLYGLISPFRKSWAVQRWRVTDRVLLTLLKNPLQGGLGGSVS